LRSDLFSADQMKAHGKALAGLHRLRASGAANPLLARLDENEEVLVGVHGLLTEAVRMERRVAPAGEWLLDNFYLVEEQIRLARLHLPEGYSHELPSLTSGPSEGLPRIYDIALQTVSHGDGHIDLDDLGSFVASYQSVSTLRLGELWALPAMLRLALIENLRRMGTRLAAGRTDRNRADHWADAVTEMARKDPKRLIVTIADMTRSCSNLSGAFVAEFARRLEGHGSALALPLTWIEQRLVESGLTINQVVQTENRQQATDQISISNSIGSLRLLASTDWRDFVESVSVVETILGGDPGGTYARMDFATRDRYRHVIERIARRVSSSEEAVAHKAIELASQAALTDNDARAAHVGWHLVAEGLPSMEQAMGVRPSLVERGLKVCQRFPLAVYAGGIGLATGAVSASLIWIVHTAGPSSIVGGAALVLSSVVVLIAVSQFATEIVNWLATLWVAAEPLPKMDLSEGIPPEWRTLTVIPTMLTSTRSVEDLVEGLEVRFLGNRDANLHFALLTDCSDAPAETASDDEQLILLARTRIEALNKKYDPEKEERFFLFHRRRLWNPTESQWMGYERKRGKLADLNALLSSDNRGPFAPVGGNTEILRHVKYVITLDTDTELPPEAARQLVGTMTHPLNRARYDPERGRVSEGYGILQPRVAVSLAGASRSRYARMFSGEPGIDPYTRAVSDVYQDVFGEGSFIGKGIYDVEAFQRSLEGRLPENRILSHDLLEGSYARAGLASDVLLFEEYPSSYTADVSRRRRWIRGDWQIARWLLPRVPGLAVRSEANPISMLSRWKILDNLRRSLVPAAFLAILLLGWTVWPLPEAWTLTMMGLIFLPLLLMAGVSACRKPEDIPWGQHLSASALSTGRRLEQAAFSIACIPYEALFSLSAIAQTNFRVLVTGKRLLEWNPSSRVEGDRDLAFRRLARSMWIGPAIAVVVTGYLAFARPSGLAQAGPVLGLWLVSPFWAWWIGRPERGVRAPRLTAAQVTFLERLSRRTWAFFETFVGKDDHWLPPDNLQENPSPVVSHRTSPTNIGLAGLANLAAYDFGYISAGRLVERTAKTFQTMERLERYRGHFYNWYDTHTLEPLLPRYISMVDSGNLAGHLLTLRNGLLALPDRPILTLRFFEGVKHGIAVLEEVAGTAPIARLNECRAMVETALENVSGAASIRTDVGHLAAITEEIAENLGTDPHSETGWWARALARQCQDALDELTLLAPEIADGGPVPTLRELAEQDGTGAQAAAAERMAAIENLALGAARFAHADYDFLFDSKSSLFSIGYNATEQRRDSSYYDLLASEARLGQFVAIAQGSAPVESWFALGRLLTRAGGNRVLISWTGSMFEYLMPLLVMPTYENTLLDETYKEAVNAQIRYGAKKGVPWGISECGYNAIDAHLNYQYRAFGVPGLGFKRGLAEDLVIAPYASALALMVCPEEAVRNLERLATLGLRGKFGFYEACDYTPARQPPGRSEVVIRSFMAHHQGMTLLSLAYLLLDRPMQRRFETDPAFRATTLLLEERIPRGTLTYPPNAEASVETNRAAYGETPTRVFDSPDTPAPNVQLLSNGRYHVMVTNAGSGYSRWRDIAVTRWREDVTRDNWGTFCYIRDVAGGEVWSVAHQPALRPAESYEAIFSDSRVEFRRRDAGIETHTEIAVSPEDDVEVRRVRLTNRSRKRRTMDITSYAEVVLASPAADALHPAFSNLFVETEVLRDRQAILCTRRPRSTGETPPWMFHLMVVEGGPAGEVSYETDRMQFVGRGRTVADPLAHSVAVLTGREGSVLDPIVAIRHRVRIEPETTVSINVVSGVAEGRESCLGMVEKYVDPRFADRAFDLAWTHSQVLLRQINATDSDAQLYGRIAGSILYANPRLRASPNVLQKNRHDQSGLWGYAISGDLPIVLLRVPDAAHIELVRQLVQAHAYWRLKGLAVDLVIWNEEQAGYRQPLQDQIMALIASGVEADVSERPGNILVRLAEHIAPEDRTLLQAVARVIIADGRTLREQLGSEVSRDRVDVVVPGREPLRPPLSSAAAFADAERELIFSNGFGGFTPDGREYIVTTTTEAMTPLPWVNVIANRTFGTVVSEAGAANTWSENAHEFRLTPWSNDAVTDASGEAFYIRDEESGRFWSPTLLPSGGGSPYVARHGFGYSVYEHTEDGVRSELWIYVAVDAPVKFAVLRVRNQSSRPRRLSVTGYVEWVLGDLREKSSMHVITEIESGSGAICARNPYGTEFGDRVAFFHVSAESHTVTADRKEFLGRNGHLSHPAAMALPRLSGRTGAALDPCAAIQVPFDLAEGHERELVFTLGAGRGMNEVQDLLRRFQGTDAARAALEAVWRYWNRTLGTVHVETPDPSVNVLLNGWLVYQTLACRFWARSAFYQPGGAIGFRDQLQDAMALVYAEPNLVREHLLVAGAHQFAEGDVQHWWHPPSGRGVRTRCSDDYLWLPLAVCRYVRITADFGVLDELVHFVEGRDLRDDEESYYDLPSRSEGASTLYDHCARAVARALRFGQRGLPLMGSGDWNDGMNLVGQHGRGESVWLAFFLYGVLEEFRQIARTRGDMAFSERCRSEAEELRGNIERSGWDGEWYRRAYFDDGSPLGSAANTECQIDSIAQSWAILSRAGEPERSRRAMAAVDERLVRRDKGLIQLLDPPFGRAGADPGYIRGYVPGVRENGGQYTHAAIWSAMAFASLGEGERAWDLAAMINPVNHGKSSGTISTYRVEPYVVAADVYAYPPHTGRGGWTWYTGSAGWMYRLLLESLLGVRLEGERLYFAPQFPPDWHAFKLHFRYRETVYHIGVRQARHGESPSIVRDGIVEAGACLSLLDDRSEHTVEIILPTSHPEAH
jgi:cyclic beta-1,2-glucan synthetase